MPTNPTQRRMSVQEYLAFDNASTDVKYEYYDGYIVAMAGGTPQHGELAVAISTALFNALRGGPCRVFSSDVRVQLAAARYVYPDVSVSCSAEDRTARDAIRSPVVVVEVLSLSTAYIDKGTKLRMYRACPSIQEYVLIDTERAQVELYRRGGEFLQYYLFGPNDVLELTSLDIKIPVADIFGDIEFPPDPDEL